jgi:acyl carrier protein
MTKEEIIDQLRTIVKPYINNQAARNLSETTDFITDLQINSANLVDIILDMKNITTLRLTRFQWKMVETCETCDILSKCN